MTAQMVSVPIEPTETDGGKDDRGHLLPVPPEDLIQVLEELLTERADTSGKPN